MGSVQLDTFVVTPEGDSASIARKCSRVITIFDIVGKCVAVEVEQVDFDDDVSRVTLRRSPSTKAVHMWWRSQAKKPATLIKATTPRAARTTTIAPEGASLQ